MLRIASACAPCAWRASIPRAPACSRTSIGIVRPDGTARWVLVKGRVSFIGEGAARKPKRGVGFVLDITERKAGRRRPSSDSEQRYRALVENANDIVATLDLEGRLTSLNPAVEAILGYAPE